MYRSGLTVDTVIAVAINNPNFCPLSKGIIQTFKKDATCNQYWLCKASWNLYTQGDGSKLSQLHLNM